MSNLIKAALIFADARHIGQLRNYTAEPYIVHPQAVAKLVADHGGTEPVIAAALLHDVVEDCGVSYDQLRSAFGRVVADLVLEVTDVSVPSDGNRAFRKNLDLIHLSNASPDGQSIKLADLIDNTQSIVQHDPGFAKVYLREKADLLEVLTAGNPGLMIIARESLMDGFATVVAERPA